MKDTRRLNSVALTESGNLAGIVGSGDNLLVLDLGPNTPENFKRWIKRRGCYYYPDVKLFRAADSMKEDTASEVRLDRQYILGVFEDLLTECLYLKGSFMGAKRPPVQALEHIFVMIDMLKLVLKNG